MDQILTILASLGFNWHVALANFINFLIILFILHRFFFGSLKKTIDTRREVIERGLSQASDAEKALARAEEEKYAIITAAKKEGHEIVVEAQTQAEKLASTIESDAHRQADEKREVLKREEAMLASKVEQEFSREAPFIVAKLYAKTLKRELTEEENNKLIASMN